MIAFLIKDVEEASVAVQQITAITDTLVGPIEEIAPIEEDSAGCTENAAASAEEQSSLFQLLLQKWLTICKNPSTRLNVSSFVKI
ncbi:hypothetical protein [Alteribacillus bidgolensis]|uniref:Methyl-accepting chemotaxis protein n=1 Tax=Alteribacillus bidgolensis TaxID=930129 RepID=A0A1G8E219_9BACI|nr:hypothetical protein [Alteribacillus bidgolensis]SDH63699.1 hypothetical protein SAMN05216352_10235 [Alteribacillus bidgolensis]